MTKANDALRKALTGRAHQTTKFYKNEIAKTYKTELAAQEALNEFGRRNNLGTARVRGDEERAIANVEKALNKQTERHNAKIDDLAYRVYEELQKGRPEEAPEEAPEEEEEKPEDKTKATEAELKAEKNWSTFRWLKSPGVIKFAHRHQVYIPDDVLRDGNKAMKSFVRKTLLF